MPLQMGAADLGCDFAPHPLAKRLGPPQLTQKQNDNRTPLGRGLIIRRVLRNVPHRPEQHWRFHAGLAKDRVLATDMPITSAQLGRDAADFGEAKRARAMAGDGSRNGRPGSGTAIATRTKAVPKKPDLYRVLLLNDDYTPMEFVVHVLMRFFNRTEEQATEIMLHVHHHGVGECGVYTYEIAETKVTQVMDFSREHQHPLQCVMEKK